MNFTRRGLSLLKYEITGGNRLEGTINISGAKNAAVAILPAALLVKGVCRIENVPDISDVRILMEILEFMGACVTKEPDGVVVLDCTNITHQSQPGPGAENACQLLYYGCFAQPFPSGQCGAARRL